MEIKVNSERAVQNRIIKLLHDYNDYTYLGNFHDTENKPYVEEILDEFLTKKQGCTPQQAKEAIHKLKDAVALCSDKDTLFNANKEVYQLLRYPTSVSQGVGKPNTQTSLIDWEHPERNLFHIAEEVTVSRTTDDGQHRRPDVVIYVNGIAVAIIELKKATVSALDGIKQQIRNQEDGQIAPFFATAQLLMAGSESEGVFYGTALTTQKFYLHWKEPAGENYSHPSKTPDAYTTKFPASQFKNELDRTLLQMLEPERLLTFMHDCVVFDGGIKKVARPNQFFAIQAAKQRIRDRENGIIWHSQGSGKSLTMVWLAQWILENITGSRVVIITDRDELDIQITNGFKDAGHHPTQAKSGEHLIKMLNGTNDKKNEQPQPDLITTLLHKFGIAGKPDEVDKKIGLRGKRSPEQYLQEVAEHLPEGFRAKGNLYVFVDECHRTQGGVLNKAMHKIMGDQVMLIGFTGTPLLKVDKEKLTSREAFGPWISTYKFDEAVRDGVVLDLRYEARNVEQQLSSSADFDQLFEHYTQGLTPRAKERIQQRWGVMQNLFSSRDRVNRIVGEIYKDFQLIAPLREGWANAMLVADSIYQAFRFWDVFEQNGYFKGKTAVVSSYDGADPALSDGFSGELKTEEEFKYNKFHEMVGKRSAEEFEAYAKSEFIDHPGKMKLLIVVDKLLTGFDAPAAMYMYIDKEMHDHNLFQAICRVNRTNGEKKQFGYIIDYKKLFEAIEGAIEDYTNGAFGNYDAEDVKGLLKNRLEEARKDLDAALEKVAKLSEPVALPKSVDDFFDFFCFNPAVHTTAEEQDAQKLKNQQIREDFYDACYTLVRRYVAIAMQMTEAGYTKEESEAIYKKVKTYDELRDAIMHRAGDYIDLKAYDAEMRALLDDYVTANRSEVLAKLDDFSFLDIIKIDDTNPDDGDVEVDPNAEKELGGQRGVAETMVSNTRRVINRKRETNPEEYRYFSEKINRLLEEYQQGTLEYKDLLKGIAELCKEMKQRNAKDPRIDTELKQALYDNLDKNVELALSVYKAVAENAKIGFRENPQRRLKVKRAIEYALEFEDAEDNGFGGMAAEPMRRYNVPEYDAEKILQIVVASREIQP